MNFGEELAYWYLRLNGFFPLTNFVYHKHDGIEHSADCDVLAYRPPAVFEAIGATENDFYPRLTTRVAFDRPAVVICEVKTGPYDTRRLFPRDRLEHAIQRAGLAVPAAQSWVDATASDHGSAVSYKLVIAPSAFETTEWTTIRTRECVAFLRARMASYPEKFRDRVYFHSALIQFLAYEAHTRGGAAAEGRALRSGAGRAQLPIDVPAAPLPREAPGQGNR